MSNCLSSLQLAALAQQESRKRQRKKTLANQTFAEWLREVAPDNNWDLKHLVKIREYLDRIIAGENLKLLIIAPPRHGKFLEGNTPVLTTKGWKKHKDLCAGDYVFDDLGNPVKVLANSGVYEWHVNIVRFAGGESLLAADEHLWKLSVDYDDHKFRRERILQTNEIFKRRNRRSPYIKSAPCLNFEKKELLIDPYLLGVWLGDGTASSAHITCGKQDLAHFSHLGKVNECKKNIFSILPDGLRGKLAKLNLLKNKHIPIDYILSSKEQRLELLCGLMDTDGCSDKRGNCEFCQKSGQLAKDVYVLLRTLGFKPTIHEYDMKLYGRIVGKKQRICFIPEREDVIFKLERKQNRIKNKLEKDKNTKYKFFIKRIDPFKKVLGNCITVEGGMYLAGDALIPTHNSFHTTIHFPAFFLEKFPKKKVIVAAYNQEASTDFSMEIRRIVAERVGVGDKWTNKAWNIIGGGSLRSVSVQAGATGKGANLFVIDDPIRGYEDAESQLKRDKIWKTYLRDLRTRLLPDGTSFILIQTTWHYDDLANRIMKSEEGKDWIVLRFPALAEENDILGRAEGEALWAEKFSRELLLNYKKDDPSGFAALYQGRPEIDGGNIFKRDWWKYYSNDWRDIKFDFIIQSVDTAWETKQQNDYSVCTTWGVKDAEVYLIDMWRDKVEYPELKQQLVKLFNEFKPMMQCIEDTSAGKAAIQELSRERIMPILPITPEGKKEVRARVVTSIVQQGKVYLPNNAPWLTDFLDEMSAFPKGRHDDIVDTVSMALNYITYNSGDPISVC